MTTTATKEKKSINRQKKYRERMLQQGAHPVTVILKDETHDILREIAKRKGVSQGAIIDGLMLELLKGENKAGSIIEERLDRIQQSDFVTSETAVHTIGLALGFLRTDLQETEDAKKTAALRKKLDKALALQKQIYFGDREAMLKCMTDYAPMVKERLESAENARRTAV